MNSSLNLKAKLFRFHHTGAQRLSTEKRGHMEREPERIKRPEEKGGGQSTTSLTGLGCVDHRKGHSRVGLHS